MAISREESIPQYSDSYLSGQDILFSQFNDVDFYIEDKDQENLYYIILKKLFSDIRITKIFPLNGKVKVIDHAEKNNGSKNKIYIVDKDFDDLHNKERTDITNLFYLQKYCIENYFLSAEALMEYVIEEKPTLKRDMLKDSDFEDVVKEKENDLSFLFATFYKIQEKGIGIKNCGKTVDMFTDERHPNKISNAKISLYLEQLKDEVGNDELYISLLSEIDQIKQSWIETNIISNNIGGKHLQPLVIRQIQKDFKLKGLPDHNSTCYRLAKNSSFANLTFLKNGINQYLSSHKD